MYFPTHLSSSFLRSSPPDPSLSFSSTHPPFLFLSSILVFYPPSYSFLLFCLLLSSPLFSSLLPTLLLSPFLCPSHFSLISFLLSSTLFPLLFFYPGANILTRSMITFGQGLNRAHPNLINIVNTLEKGDDLKGFTREVKLH